MNIKQEIKWLKWMKENFKLDITAIADHVTILVQ